MKSTFRGIKFFGLFVAILAILQISSCMPVNFSGKDEASVGVTPLDPGPVDPAGSITCNPKLNSNQSSVTMTVGGANPTLTANCNPTTVNYIWTVTKAGSAVTVNGLTGASSTPDFSAAGPGTYQIDFKATSSSLSTYTLATPLTVIVNSGGTNPLPSITCQPRINGNQTSVTVNSSSQSIQISAFCNPSDVSYVWTVTKNGAMNVAVAGLSGSQSTPDFFAQGPGVYTVFLQASKTGFNTFTNSQPLTITVQATPTRTVNYSKTVTYEDNQLDILLVLDDSNSMLADNRRLAQRLQGFVQDLSGAGFDWQMCITLTRNQRVSATNPTLYWGASNNWTGKSSAPTWIINSSTPNPYDVFTRTIETIGAGNVGSDDERGIKAAWWHLWNGDPNVSDVSGCYRKKAGLSVIIISDEDVRSVGGDATQVFYPGEFQPLENDDLPITYVSHAKEIFGNDKRFTVNSIIVRPGDSQCMAAQDAEGAKSHFGMKYNELSQLTNGYVGSICDADYSTNLRYFKDKIVSSLASIPLECVPVGNVDVSVTPSMGGINAYVEGQNLRFNPAVPVGRTVTLQYNCSI